MTNRFILSAIINLLSYSLVFPFAGAFVILLCDSFVKYGPAGIFITPMLAPMAGLLAIAMFWALGIAASVFPILFVSNYQNSMICNILCSAGLVCFIHNLPGNIFHDYSAAMYLLSACHALALTRITQSVLGNNPPLFRSISRCPANSESTRQ
jgi:hypothetical protein